VCVWRRGVFKTLSKYPIQLCQFHQVSIVTRYITREHRVQVSIELKEILHLLAQKDKESFFGTLDQCYAKVGRICQLKGY